MNKEYGMYLAMAAAFFALVAGIWWTNAHRASVTPVETVATSSEPSMTTASSTADGSSTPVVPAKTPQVVAPLQPRFTLVPGETVASWDFVGTHKDGGSLEASVNAEIARTKSLLHSGEFTDYELYVSIANQYELLGDGGREYEYLGYALKRDSTKTGLAWHNMAKLLERLGAYKSARVAYDRLVLIQPTRQYILARLEFLKAHMPEDTDAIKQAEIDLAASGE